MRYPLRQIGACLRGRKRNLHEPGAAADHAAQSLTHQLAKRENLAASELECPARSARVVEHPGHLLGDVVYMDRLETCTPTADQGDCGRTPGERGKSREEMIVWSVHQCTNSRLLGGLFFAPLSPSNQAALVITISKFSFAIAAACCGAGFVQVHAAQNARSLQSETGRIAVENVANRLEHPWGMAFLPDRRLLVRERSGRLRILAKDGKLSGAVPGAPKVFAEGQGGLLDVALDPEFAFCGSVRRNNEGARV